MKKNLFIILSLFAVSLAWCTTSNNQVINIDPQEWEQLFNTQVEEFQYIKDLEDFLSYNVLSLTEDKPFTSDLYLSAEFDENSSLQWWVDFSQRKISKAHNLEAADMEITIKAENLEKDSTPFDLSWNVSLLYKDWEMYANLHSLDVFMWEGNMVAKMYTLLWGLVIDSWVDLEVHSWWAITLNESEDKRLSYIIWTLKNVLKTENVKSSPNFLNSVAELIDTINSRIDLWIFTDELSMVSHEISYSELSDKTIQKEFIWVFQWKKSAFDMSFVVSKKWFDARLYNIREYNEEVSDYKDQDVEFLFSLNEDNKSEYIVKFESVKDQQKVVDLQWKIKYANTVNFSANFVMEPLELVNWQKISWIVEWNITKKRWESDREFPELTWEILSLNWILSSL